MKEDGREGKEERSIERAERKKRRGDKSRPEDTLMTKETLMKTPW